MSGEDASELVRCCVARFCQLACARANLCCTVYCSFTFISGKQISPKFWSTVPATWMHCDCWLNWRLAKRF